MSRSSPTLRPLEILIRVLADLAVLQASMIAALGVSVIYQTANGNSAMAGYVIRGFTRYYWTSAWWISLTFLLVFLLNGFYTHSRSYVGKYKVLVIFRGVGLGTLLILAGHYFIFQVEQTARSVMLPLAVFATLGLTGTRMLKALLEKYYLINPKVEVNSGPADRILVVGGAGYIGNFVVRRLLENGRKVRILDSLVYGDEGLRGIREHPNLDLIAGDCRNIQDMVAAMRGVESVVHLAAIVGDPACQQDPKTALEINYAATRMLIEIAKGHGVNRFLFASSCSVYGASDEEMDEKCAVQPLSLYGQTKLDSEKALLEARTPDFSPIILRFATVFGFSKRPRFDLVINLLAARAFQEKLITIYNGAQWRPFLHVQDAAEAVVFLCHAPLAAVGGQILNVGDSRLNYTLSQVAMKISAVFPDTRVQHVENSDRRDYRVSFKKIRQLGFQCRYDLDYGIREIKEAFDQKLVVDYKDVRYNNLSVLQTSGTPGYRAEHDAKVMEAFSNA